MAFLLLPALFTLLLVTYLAYLYFYKKDSVKFRSVLYPGLFFLAAWALVYFFVFR